MNEESRCLIRISQKFVPRGPIAYKSSLVKVMAWRQIGDKPLHEAMLTQIRDAYIRHKGES